MSEAVAVQAPVESPAAPQAEETGFDESALRESALKLLETEGDAEPEGSTDAEQKPKEEPAKDPEEPEKEDSEDSLERKAAAITAKGRRLRARIEEFTAKKAEFETQAEGFKKEREEFNASRERAKTSPLEALKALGWSYEDLQSYVLQDGSIPIEKRLKDAEERFNKELAEKLKTVEEGQKQLAEQQLYAKASAYKTQAENRTFDALRSGDFPLAAKVARVSPEDAEQLVTAVLGTITAEYKKSGGKKILAPEEVLRNIESRLERQRRLLTGDDAPQGGAVKTAKPEAGKEPRVPTNAQATERVVQRSNSDDFDPEKDPEYLKQQALAVLNG